MSKTEKKCWSESFGVYGSTIRVSEREPGGILYLLWVDNKGKQRKRSLRHRDRAYGRKQAKELAGRLLSEPAAPAFPKPLRTMLLLSVLLGLALGILTTDWGDNGHWQPPGISWPGFAAGAV